MVEEDLVVERDVEDGLGLAVVFVIELAVLEFDGAAFRHEGDTHGVGIGLDGGGAGVLIFFFVHKNSLLPLAYLISAGAIGCGASGPSPRFACSMVLPFRAEATAESIISSARRMVPWFSASMALRSAWWSSPSMTSRSAFSSFEICLRSSEVSCCQAGLFLPFSSAVRMVPAS